MPILHLLSSKTRQLLTLALSIALVSAVAQSKESGINNDFYTLLFSSPHIGLTATPYVTPAAVFTPENTNRYQFSTTAQRGFEAGLHYTSHLAKDWSIVTGIQIGFAGRNTRYVIPKEDLDPQAQHAIHHEGPLARHRDATYASLPVMLEKRWLKKGKSYWSTALGTNLRIRLVQTLSASAYTVDGSNWREYYRMTFERGAGTWINFNAAGGYNRLLKNNHLVSLKLLANYAPSAFVKGTYTFDLPGKPIERGTYRLKGSFIGLSASYTLTNMNKKLRQLQRR
jgi:hypothetical protein